jgi:hypothetical protein
VSKETDEIEYECMACGYAVKSEDKVCPKCGDNLEEEITDQSESEAKVKLMNNQQVTASVSDRPAKVGAAVKLIYICSVIGIVLSIMNSSNDKQIRSLVVTLAINMSGREAGGLIAIFLAYMIGKGHNLSRIIVTISFVIGTLFTLFSLYSFWAINHNSIQIVFGLIMMIPVVLMLIAVLFLWQKPSSDWFREMKSKK